MSEEYKNLSGDGAEAVEPDNKDIEIDQTESDTVEKTPSEQASAKPIKTRDEAKLAFRKKKLQRGSMSVVITVLVVAIVVVLNVVVNTLLDRFNVKIDLTDSQLYSIADSTVEYLKNLENGVNLIVTSSEADIQKMDIYYSQMNEIAKRFAASGNDINVSYVDLMTTPSFSGQYGGNLTAASLVVESKVTGRYKVLTPNDYLSIKYYTQDGTEVPQDQAYYYQMLGMQVYQDVSAAAEQTILSAILSVSDNSPVRVAFTTGFGEDADQGGVTLFDAAKELFEKNAYVTETIDMNLVEEIDSEIDYLVIYAPVVDYSIQALTAIDKWLDNSAQFGKNVIYVSSIQNMETPNLDGFLADWGLQCEKGFIWQTDANYINTSNTYQYLQLGSGSKYGDEIKDKAFIGYLVRPVSAISGSRANVETTSVLMSYDGAVLVPYDATESWNPEAEQKGTLSAITESKKTTYSGSTELTSRVIAFGSPYLMDEYFLTAQQVGHAELYVDMLNTISGKEQRVSLTNKSFWMSTFNISQSQVAVITIIFCIALPVLVFATGLIVWIRRRHL